MINNKLPLKKVKKDKKLRMINNNLSPIKIKKIEKNKIKKEG